MKSILSYSLLAAAMAAGVAIGQTPTTATTTPVGYTSISCLPGSDTIVGLPLRLSASAAGALTSAPSTSGSQAVLTVSGASFGSFAGTHYVKFKESATAKGKWFPVASNTADTLTIDLNGVTLSAAIGDKIEVLKFWTLAELIDPSTATDNPATTPNAIVASSNIGPTGRKTEVLVPNFLATGINIAPSTVYFIHGGIWKKQGGVNNSFNNDQLWPDSYIIIRNPASIGSSTKFVVSGEVETGNFEVAVNTLAAGKQDNFVALPRPIDTKLKDLGLGGTAAFVSSDGIGPTQRKDELLVFNNAAAALNKSASAIYFYHAGIWKKQGGVNADFGDDVIPAGGGFILRKFQSGTGATATWNNAPSY
ncbi:MAG: TIGR02597 family protein [Akkermansiaceae bacterium]|nr:TIGR02597 family protein [Akkermansiaceae bacterium]